MYYEKSDAKKSSPRAGLEKPAKQIHRPAQATNGLDEENTSRVYKVGEEGISKPVILRRVEADYSAEAIHAKASGDVVLSIVIDTKGIPSLIKVLQSPGYGLDRKAAEAVQQWRFRPAFKNGHPVPVFAEIRVRFREV